MAYNSFIEFDYNQSYEVFWVQVINLKLEITC